MVLYEMFAGKRRSDTQTAPTELVKELDPVIDRVNAAMPDEDPRNRPSSVLAVAMALPGGDPMAAALAAGETPSPEIVAASAERKNSPHKAKNCPAMPGGRAGSYDRYNSGGTAHHPYRYDTDEYPPDALAFKRARC